MLKLLSLCLLVVSIAAFPKPKATNCGYQSCPATKAGMLNVHLIPHSHDDVGWLKTLDQYYYGNRNDIQKAGVQYIIDSVIEELQANPSRRFIQVETAFFWKWWLEQSEATRDVVKSLVDNGRLEFIGGAWSMEDEATTHYHSNIDQYSWGLRKLNDTFGECGRPRVGWQIDPFGHSRETASMFARFGFDGLFLGRIDYQDKDNRLKTKTMEMIWEGSQVLAESTTIWTNVLYFGQPGYGSPPNFCFDVLCNDDPLIDDTGSYDYNIVSRVDEFLAFSSEQGKYYATNNILVPMGGDFNYQSAHINFKNMDKLIKYVNERQQSGSKVNVLYSTPSCYLKSVNEANVTWGIKQDDFFPYASDPHAYWTGYFTSRPTLKYFERRGNNFLQVCKQLYTLAGLNANDNAELDLMIEVMGVMQHHDAVAGTEKQHVADDYSRMLNDGFNQCQRASDLALGKLTTKTGSTSLTFDSCHLRNISECDVTSDAKNFVVTLYNPLSRNVNHHVRVPVGNNNYQVRDASGAAVVSQVVDVPEAVLNIPGRTATTTQELVFRAEDIPALGYKSYYVSASAAKRHNSHKKMRVHSPRADVQIGDSAATATVDGTSGLLKSVTIDGVTTNVAHNFFYYEGALGNNGEFNNRSSGAYIFRPNSTSYPVSSAAQVDVIRGEVVDEIHQTFNDRVSQIIRHYKNERHLEFEWLVGPIPIEDGVGKEVITRFSSDITSNSRFFTDSNGRESVERVRDFRPTWEYEVQEPVSGNYYPVTNWIYVQDGQKNLAVLADRAQGGSSMQDGAVEIMVHRRLLHDDAFGVGEALNETAFGQGLVVRGRHWLTTSESGDETQMRVLNQEKTLDSWVFVSNADSIDFNTWASSYNTQGSGVVSSLHDSVQILTLESWKDDTVLFRLENILTSGGDIEVDLETILSGFTITNVRETNLAANQWIEDFDRMKWSKETNNNVKQTTTDNNRQQRATLVTLGPLQIRTFVLDVQRN